MILDPTMRLAAALTRLDAVASRRRRPSRIPGSRRAMRGCATTSSSSSDAGIVRAPLTAWPVSWAGGRARRPRTHARAGAAAAWLAAALARVQAAAGDATRTGQPAARSLALRDPNSRWRCAASRDVPREEGEVVGAASSTLGERFAFRAAGDRRRRRRTTARTYPPRRQLCRRGARQLDAACRLHRSLVGAGLGGQPHLRQQCAADPVRSPSSAIIPIAIDHPWLQLDRAVPLRGDDGPARRRPRRRAERAVLRHARDLEAASARRDRHFAQRPVVRRRASLRPRHVLGPARSATTMTSRSRTSRATSWRASTRAGRCPWRRSPSMARRSARTRRISCRASTSVSFGIEFWGGFGDRSWRAHVEYADTACSFYESDPNFGCAYRNVIYSRRLPVLRPLDRPLDRRRQPASSPPASCS